MDGKMLVEFKCLLTWKTDDKTRQDLQISSKNAFSNKNKRFCLDVNSVVRDHAYLLGWRWLKVEEDL